jgi:hypothetical protein
MTHPVRPCSAISALEIDADFFALTHARTSVGAKTLCNTSLARIGLPPVISTLASLAVSMRALHHLQQANSLLATGKMWGNLSAGPDGGGRVAGGC